MAVGAHGDGRRGGRARHRRGGPDEPRQARSTHQRVPRPAPTSPPSLTSSANAVAARDSRAARHRGRLGRTPRGVGLRPSELPSQQGDRMHVEGHEGTGADPNVESVRQSPAAQGFQGQEVVPPRAAPPLGSRGTVHRRCVVAVRAGAEADEQGTSLAYREPAAYENLDVRSPWPAEPARGAPSCRSREIDVLLGSGVHRGPETRRLNVRRHRHPPGGRSPAQGVRNPSRRDVGRRRYSQWSPATSRRCPRLTARSACGPSWLGPPSGFYVERR